MGRTCEPASIANQILQAVGHLLGANPEPSVYEYTARREFERYTLGLCDYERQEVLYALVVQSHGLIR
jgi:hypothetical protein